MLLPIAVLGALALVAMGIPQNLSPGHAVTSLVGQAQTIPGGPVASQEVIKELGTNGGGFYNANSAHPFENPNPLSNLFTTFLMLVIPVSLTRTFGLIVGDKRQGYALLGVMATIWGVFLAAATFFEVRGLERAGGGRGRRRDGGQGDPIRDLGLDAVGDLHDRYLHRRRERGP